MYRLQYIIYTIYILTEKNAKDKCEFCCSSLVYLGFLFDKGGLRPDPVKVAPMLEYRRKQ